MDIVDLVDDIPLYMGFSAGPIIIVNRGGVRKATNASNDSAIDANLQTLMSTKHRHDIGSAYHQHEELTDSDSSLFAANVLPLLPNLPC